MGLSADDKLQLERIESDFTYHPPDAKQAEKYQHMRRTAQGLAKQIIELCPGGRERALALTRLEESVMWANAAIARHEAE